MSLGPAPPAGPRGPLEMSGESSTRHCWQHHTCAISLVFAYAPLSSNQVLSATHNGSLVATVSQLQEYLETQLSHCS